jgi:hypothetical protein
MENFRQGVKGRWDAMGMAARLWWVGAASLGLAAVMVLGVTTMSDAAAHPAPSTSGSAASSGSPDSASTPGGASTAGDSGSMAGMAGMAGSSGSRAVAASNPSPICPNVADTTVMSNGMVMAPVPSGAPTPAEQAAANQLVAETTADVAKYANLSAAIAAGYVPATNPNGYEVHYANWSIVRSGDVLDPTHPSSLVYANTDKGPLLLGAMYLGAGPCLPGPDVGGPLTQWHAHDNLCLSSAHQVVGKTDASGTCTTGTHNTSTYFMLHVWVAPSLASAHQFQPDLTKAELAPIIRTGQG